MDREDLLKRIEEAMDLLREIRSRYVNVERYPDIPYSLFFGSGEEDEAIDRQIAEIKASATEEVKAIDTTLRILEDLRLVTLGELPPE